MTTSDIAIIGAGIAGLSCAHELDRLGYTSTVVDKARGPGGRMASRRLEERAVDIGAQYFTCRHDDFAAAVAIWQRHGVVAPWEGRFVTIDARGGMAAESPPAQRWVGTPRMSALTRHLADACEVRPRFRVDHLDRRPDGWYLIADDGTVLGPYGWVISTAPTLQTITLLDGHSALAAVAADSTIAPCWTAVLQPRLPVAQRFDGAKIDHPVVSWIAADHSKPGRSGPQTWVIHASAQWSERHLDSDPADVLPHLSGAWRFLVDCAESRYTCAFAHRWRYARVTEPIDGDATIDAEHRLAIAGDWCRAGRVEDAWLSGRDTARQVAAQW